MLYDKNWLKGIRGRVDYFESEMHGDDLHYPNGLKDRRKRRDNDIAVCDWLVVLSIIGLISLCVVVLKWGG